MRVEIWSDVVCPWCYIGKRRFEAALAQFPHAADLEIRWRSFELDPSAPPERTGDPALHLAKKYRMTEERARAAQAHVAEVARGEGLAFDLEHTRAGNTFDAHRLIHLAASRGLADAAEERLMRAYFVERQPIGLRHTLVSLAAEIGLDADEATAALAGDAFADAVRADEAEASRIGANGVPFFVLGRRYALSGAQPAELVAKALERAWNDVGERQAAMRRARAKPGCDDGSCEA